MNVHLIFFQIKKTVGQKVIFFSRYVRPRERYIIIYMYKIIIGMVPNPGFDKEYNPRTKIRVKPKVCNNAPSWVRKVRTSSFFYSGPVLYNKLPLQMRELEDIQTPSQKHISAFKTKLDSYLANIPDLPGSIHNSLAVQ